LPPPSTARTRVQSKASDGVRILHVNDPAEDLALLLKCLYSPLELPFKRGEPSPSTVNFGGLLRLCKQYKIPTLAKSLVDQLKSEWPSSLSARDNIQSSTRRMREEHAAAPKGMIDNQYIDDRLLESASIVRIECEFNIPELLPGALYQLSTINLSLDWDTFHTAGHDRSRRTPPNSRMARAPRASPSSARRTSCVSRK
ncbi:hypothetical protein B0H10DRAFT_1783862, partial [Mycena sp. CBHHK59/15]